MTWNAEQNVFFNLFYISTLEKHTVIIVSISIINILKITCFKTMNYLCVLIKNIFRETVISLIVLNLFVELLYENYNSSIDFYSNLLLLPWMTKPLCECLPRYRPSSSDLSDKVSFVCLFKLCRGFILNTNSVLEISTISMN